MSKTNIHPSLKCIGVGCPYEQSSAQSTRPDELFSALKDDSLLVSYRDMIEQISDSKAIWEIMVCEDKILLFLIL